MCLTVLDKNHDIAESDITCYKLFKIKSGKLVKTHPVAYNDKSVFLRIRLWHILRIY